METAVSARCSKALLRRKKHNESACVTKLVYTLKAMDDGESTIGRVHSATGVDEGHA